MRPTAETEREIVGICQAALDRAGERSALNYGAIQAVTRVDARTTSFREVASAIFELLFQIGARLTHPTNARSRLRSGRTKTTNAGLALRPFARQEVTSPAQSLVPFRSGPSQGSSPAILTEPHDELA